VPHPGPWRTTPITYHHAEALARHLSTACAVVIGYLSGMRPGEVASLERGCLTHDTATGMLLLRGRHWKGVRTLTGAKLPHGEIRDDPWVVAEPVATAVNVLERLHTATLLFPTTLQTNGNAGPRALHSRVGKARSDSQTNLDIAHLIDWINQYCHDQHRTDPIPADPHAPITVSRLRRTLAWFIARKPRGLVAAAIQYGHLRVQMTLGYAKARELHQTGEKALVV
jgi:integrase